MNASTFPKILEGGSDFKEIADRANSVRLSLETVMSQILPPDPKDYPNGFLGEEGRAAFAQYLKHMDMLSEIAAFYLQKGFRANSEATVKIGSIVKYNDLMKREGHVLACGSGTYPDAVVVSVDPLVLVSRETDMLWSADMMKKDFQVVGTADDTLLEECIKRYIRK